MSETSETESPARVPAKLVDVARHAGVSTGTVSNVLNRPGRVGADLRARVEQSIEELGFLGSRVASQLKNGRSSLIGVVLPDVGNPFWADLLRGVEQVLDRYDLTLVVASTRLDPAREGRLLEALGRHRVDGLILAPSRRSFQLAEVFLDRPFGVVTLDGRISGSRWSSVALDDVKGGELAAGHLLERGYRRLVLVNCSDSASWPADRRAGVRKAIAEHGLLEADCLTEVLPAGEGTVADGLAAAEEVAHAVRGEPTGVICGNDLLALGLLRGLHDRGLRVPEDLALVGYDDVDFAAALSPGLTSVRQPSFDMGAAAARLLMHNPSGEESQVTFEPELIARESTARTVPPE